MKPQDKIAWVQLLATAGMVLAAGWITGGGAHFWIGLGAACLVGLLFV